MHFSEKVSGRKAGLKITVRGVFTGSESQSGILRSRFTPLKAVRFFIFVNALKKQVILARCTAGLYPVPCHRWLLFLLKGLARADCFPGEDIAELAGIAV